MRRLLLFLGAAMLLATVSVASSVSPPHQPAEASSTETMLSTPLPNGIITSGYENFVSGLGYHLALDYDVPASASPPPADETDDVESVASGRVVKIFNGCERQSGSLSSRCGGGFGNYVIVRHRLNNSTGPLVYSTYAHLDAIETGLAVNQCIAAGDAVGELGHTGTGTAEHLHFEINDSAVQHGYTSTLPGPSGSNDPTEMLGSQTVYDFCGGTPDADGDGIDDVDDACENVAGHETADGCPDADGDGFRDDNGDDDCVGESGTINGCPDTDGDTVTDGDDDCPDEPGLVSNNGCPPDPVSLIQKYQVDYDSDGDEDILFLYRSGSHLRLAAVWGSSAGTTSTNNIWEWAWFGASTPVTPAGLGDFNGDGHVDVMFLYPDGNENHLRMAAVWGQSGTGVRSSTNNVWEWAWFLQSDPDRAIYPVGITNFDADGSGTDDVLIMYRSSGHLRMAAVWGQSGTGTRTSTNNIWEWAWFGASKSFELGGLADLDDDGDEDVTIFYRAGNHLRMATIWGSSGTGTKSWATNIWEFANFNTSDPDKLVMPVGSLDFDVDGDDDIVFFYFGGEHLRLGSVWGSSGTGTKSSTNNIWEWANYGSGNDVHLIEPVDLDDDGDQDVAFRHWASNHLRLSVIWGESGTGVRSWKSNISEWAYFGTSNEFHEAGILDLDDDGDEDIAFFHNVSGDHLRLGVVWGSTSTTSKILTMTEWEWAWFLQADPDREYIPLN